MLPNEQEYQEMLTEYLFDADNSQDTLDDAAMAEWERSMSEELVGIND